MRNQLLWDAHWAGMVHSLEIRLPSVDVALLRAAAPLLASSTPPTKQDVASCSLAEPLLDEVLHRRKSGFTVPVRERLLRAGAIGSNERMLRGWARLVYDSYRGNK